MSAETLLFVEGLTKAYGDHVVLDNISTEVKRGEVIAIIGPSGCGKSTFLRSLNQLEKITSGCILFEGVDITGSSVDINNIRRKIGMVFQSYDLFPNMTVLENIVLAPTKVQHREQKEAEAEAKKLLTMVGLSDYEQAYPRQLSGGQKQRIAIIRALAMHPDLMLFDEVTASLDPEMVRGALEIIKKLSDEEDMTMLIVTHEMNFAAQIADRVLFLEDGHILEDTPGQQFFKQPQTERAQQFLESMDF